MTEFELIELLTRGVDRSAADLAAGVGDDCAVISGPSGRQWLVTTDLLVEGTHFDLAFTDLATLGRKALSVNLSDIAAMGGAPRFWLASIALPGSIGADGAGLLYKGMRDVAGEHGAILIGGDTSSSRERLLISITAVGECASGCAVMRSGAHPGDAVYVTGELGGSALGLALMRRGFMDRGAELFVERHNDPAPRVEAGRVLAASGALTSMIDVSDGLMADMGHIADASGAGFEIRADRVPIGSRFGEFAEKVDSGVWGFILSGGEDYELAFTVDAAKVAEFERDAMQKAGVRVTRIGEMLKDPSARRAMLADGSELGLSSIGFDHFRGQA